MGFFSDNLQLQELFLVAVSVDIRSIKAAIASVAYQLPVYRAGTNSRN
ncbi:hypothetical protein [Ancylomarina longa]|nr:hypothetical protein [Ancylomarina longa]